MTVAISQILDDIRFAFRQWRRQPGLTLSVILLLGLGIGLSVAVFSILYVILLKPLPYRQSEHLLSLHNVFPKARTAPSGISTVDYIELRKHREVFSDVAEYYFNDLTLTGAGAPRHVDPVNTAASLFRLLGVPPALGRTISEEDDRYDAPKVAVLSDSFWQSAFHKNPRVIGQTIRLDEVPYEIVGVMPPQFQFPYPATQLWLPLALTPSDLEGKGRLDRWASSIARLKPGVTQEQAEAALRVIGHQMAVRHSQFPEFFPEKEGWHFSTTFLLEEQTHNVRSWILLAFGAVFLVLLIACSNVSGLLLIRTLSRSTEMAVRSALGADTFRLRQQILTETGLLVLAGSGLGFITASWLLDLCRRYGPFSQSIEMQTWSIWFAMATALFCTVTAGLFPALASTKFQWGYTCKPGATRNWTSASGLRSLLATGQVALAVVLVFTAVLLSRSFLKLLSQSPGFEPKHVWSGLIQLPSKLYATPDAQLRFFQTLQQRAAQLPGVASASVSAPLPFDENGVWSVELRFPSHPPQRNQPRAEAMAVLPGYFRTMQIPVLQGRTFLLNDQPSTPLSVINEEFARSYFPGENPLGKQVVISGGKPATIIGVVGDIENTQLGSPHKPQIYWSVLLEPVSAMCLVIRTQSDLEITNAVRTELTKLDAHVALFNVATMEERIEHTVRLRRFMALVLNAFGSAGILLAALGLYGSLAHMVVLRRREIGIRMALGAAWQNIAGIIWRQCLFIAGVGSVFGVVGATGAGRLLRNQVFGVGTDDGVTWIIVLCVLTFVAVLAAWFPTWRVMKIQPTEALREE